MENPTKKDDLGGKPTIFGNIHMVWILFLRIAILSNLNTTWGKLKIPGSDLKINEIFEIPPYVLIG